MSETITKPETKPETVSMLKAINMALFEAMEADPTVLVFGEDVADREGGGVVGASRGLSTKFGDHRVKSTPIAEQAIIGAAIGAAMGGFRPVAEIMLMNFTAVAMDMIVNHAAKLRYMSGGQTKVPLVIRTMCGAGGQVAGQHSDSLEAWFAHTPGLKVIAPSNPADAKGLLLSCIFDDDPCIFLECRTIYQKSGPVGAPGVRIPLGKASVVRQGTDVTVVTYARQVHEALASAEEMQAKGISVEVIDLRTISPWDKETVLRSVAKTKRAVVMHEAVRTFGVGAEIAATIGEELFSELKAPVRRIGAPFTPVPFAKQLEDIYVPNQADLSAVISALVKK